MVKPLAKAGSFIAAASKAMPRATTDPKPTPPTEPPNKRQKRDGVAAAAALRPGSSGNAARGAEPWRIAAASTEDCGLAIGDHDLEKIICISGFPVVVDLPRLA